MRRLHRAEEMSIQATARKLGISRTTVRRAVARERPPKYERAPKGSIVDAVEPKIRELLEVLEAAVSECGEVAGDQAPRRRWCGRRRRSGRAGTGRSRARPRRQGRCLACETLECLRRRRRGWHRGRGRRRAAGTPARGRCRTPQRSTPPTTSCPAGARRGLRARHGPGQGEDSDCTPNVVHRLFLSPAVVRIQPGAAAGQFEKQSD